MVIISSAVSALTLSQEDSRIKQVLEIDSASQDNLMLQSSQFEILQDVVKNNDTILIDSLNKNVTQKSIRQSDENATHIEITSTSPSTTPTTINFQHNDSGISLTPTISTPNDKESITMEKNSSQHPIASLKSTNSMNTSEKESSKSITKIINEQQYETTHDPGIKHKVVAHIIKTGTDSIKDTTADIVPIETTKHDSEYTVMMEIDSTTQYSTIITDTKPVTNKDALNIADITTLTSNTEQSIMENLFTSTHRLDSMDDLSYTTDKYEDLSRTDNLPLKKKYTVIERARKPIISDEATTVTMSDGMVKSDTKHPRISLQEALNMTSDIPSIEKLKNDFYSFTKLLTTESITTQEMTKIAIDQKMELNTEIQFTTLPSVTHVVLTKPLNIVTGSRAGFLNVSSELDKNGTEDVEEGATSQTNSDLYDILFNDAFIDRQNKTAAESRSQLMEDAIEEEMLKEELIINTKENLEKRNSTSFTVTSNDNLAVKPITIEKKNMYAVNPIYKPLKKIEIQPPKAFVRNPDDHSWRNESLSSLGIVFKANNSSKPFTQVLKNKTDNDLNSIGEKESKSDVPELRRRLEKIAENRKKVKYNDGTLYSDEIITLKENNISSKVSEFTVTETPVTQSDSTLSSPRTLKPEITRMNDKFSLYNEEIKSTKVPKKFFNLAEYYDSSVEDDVEYITLSNIDLKKFISPSRLTTSTTSTTASPIPIKQYLTDRKPTLQYFPPRTTQTVSVNQYDDDFQRRLNSFTVFNSPNAITTTSTTTVPTVHQNVQINSLKTSADKYKIFDKDIYQSNVPDKNKQIDDYRRVNQDGDIQFGSREYFNFFKNLAKQENEFERSTEYIPHFSPSPLRDIQLKFPQTKDKEIFDYEIQFGKEILDRFIDNFNQNHGQYKVDFPIVYNNTIVHKKTQEDGKVVASSSAFMRRLYNDETQRNRNAGHNNVVCDPNCDKLVELSPAYELHYYVPEQEEREIADQRAKLPDSYRIPIT